MDNKPKKKCGTCKEDKDRKEFGARRENPDGLKNDCAKCTNEKAKERLRKKPIPIF